ncbi:hypothetical protein BpHYR1_046446 [Brachionus plicatilis]|uniref:Uncharacterized protein n=1 Tax=Brachionus plicatilis TaxID=10195 RepID=A0A3M7RI21_BRAPC|nr:hypothetical protein BpHYR1_046446 [Brachionus plicatilis]
MVYIDSQKVEQWTGFFVVEWRAHLLFPEFSLLRRENWSCELVRWPLTIRLYSRKKKEFLWEKFLRKQMVPVLDLNHLSRCGAEMKSCAAAVASTLKLSFSRKCLC